MYLPHESINSVLYTQCQQNSSPFSLLPEGKFGTHQSRSGPGLPFDSACPSISSSGHCGLTVYKHMQTLATVLLKPGEADRILAGHPWIYHGSVLRLTQPAVDGELVQVKDHRQRFLGVGFYNSKSKINVRVLSPERVEVNQNFFGERIRAALAVRQKHLPNA